MIKEFTEYIGANTSLVIDTTLFAISVDSDLIDTCVVIAEQSPGLANSLLTDYRQIPLVAYSRATTRFTARDNAYTVFDLLSGATQINFTAIGSGPVYWCNIECRTPYYIGMDDTKRRYMYAVPIDVTVTNML